MRRLLPFLVLALLALTGCQAQTKIELEAQPDGSGTVQVAVTLDPEAAKNFPDFVNQLRTSDLAKAGWTIDDPKSTTDGALTVKAHHDFGTPAEATAVLQQLTGNDGAFKDFRLAQDRSLFKSSTTFDGTVDLTNGVDSLGNAQLQSRFGHALGFDSNEAAGAAGVQWPEVLPIDIEVHLPGGGRMSQPATQDNVWHLTYGGVTPLHAAASGVDAQPIGLMSAAVVLLVIAALVWKFWSGTSYRPAHRGKRKSGGVRARDLLNGTATVEDDQ